MGTEPAFTEAGMGGGQYPGIPKHPAPFLHQELPQLLLPTHPAPEALSCAGCCPHTVPWGLPWAGATSAGEEEGEVPS